MLRVRLRDADGRRNLVSLRVPFSIEVYFVSKRDLFMASRWNESDCIRVSKVFDSSTFRTISDVVNYIGFVVNWLDGQMCRLCYEIIISNRITRTGSFAMATLVPFTRFYTCWEAGFLIFDVMIRRFLGVYMNRVAKLNVADYNSINCVKKRRMGKMGCDNGSFVIWCNAIWMTTKNGTCWDNSFPSVSSGVAQIMEASVSFGKVSTWAATTLNGEHSSSLCHGLVVAIACNDLGCCEEFAWDLVERKQGSADVLLKDEGFEGDFCKVGFFCSAARVPFGYEVTTPSQATVEEIRLLSTGEDKELMVRGKGQKMQVNWVFHSRLWKQVYSVALFSARTGSNLRLLAAPD